MERVKLSRTAKEVFRLLVAGKYSCPEYMILEYFNAGAKELRAKYLAICHEEESGNVEIAKLSEMGKIYYRENPSLRNPVDWKWIIIATVAAVAGVTALFLACKIIN